MPKKGGGGPLPIALGSEIPLWGRIRYFIPWHQSRQSQPR
ncbi:hypothetical protein M2366_001060 [Aeromonas sp. BIGb0405]|nr:hypothetical protein [Aeromonas sp. BIGb0405]